MLAYCRLRFHNSTTTLRFFFQNLCSFAINAADVTSLNKLMDGYSKSGDLFSAQRLFDEMPERDIVSWNSIMSAYARNNYYDQVLKIFSKMHFSGLKPSATSLSTVLSSCAKLKALYQGKQAHGLSIKLSSSANVFVGTSLITMYASCHTCDCLILVCDDIDVPNVASWNALVSGFVLNRRINDARGVFDRMPIRNVVSWTTMINGYIEVEDTKTAFELFNLVPVKNSVCWSVMLGGFTGDGKFDEALALFANMIHDCVPVTEVSLIYVIGACRGLKDPKQGKKIHACILKLGFVDDEMVEASLVSMYCECLHLEEARLEFDKMETQVVGSWNSLLCSYVNCSKIDEARKLFDSMIYKDDISWNLMIDGYSKCNRVVDAFAIFSQMPKPTLETVTTLMSSFIKHGRLDDAQNLFNRIPQPDVVACTTLVYGYVKEGLIEDAYRIFNRMPERSVVTYNVMINGFLQHNKVKEACKLFSESPERDLTTWTALIAGFIQNGLYHEAFTLYKKMILSYTCSSRIVLASLLSVFARLSSLIHGEQTHNVSIKLGHDSCLVVRNALIDMYGKCGNMSLAKSVFQLISDFDVITWNAMISGYACNGLGENAIEMFENMKRTDVKPDEVTFLAVLTACSHKSLLPEAQKYLLSMTRDYGIVPNLMHFACLADLLCRKGMVEDAEKLICSVPYKPDPAVWTALLNGSKSSHTIYLAQHAATKLLTLHPKDPMPYLHLLDIYKSSNRWIEMEILQKQTYRIRTKSSAACSWIETSNLV